MLKKKKNEDIFNHFLVRVGSHSILELAPNANSHLLTLIDEIYVAEIKKNELITTICDHLYCLAKNCNSDAERKKIISLKRDIFNERSFTVENLHINFNEEIKANICELLNLYKNIQLKESSINNHYSITVMQEIDIINKFCKNDLFQKGILLSSKHLYTFIQNPVIATDRNRDEYIGLWKYITRSVCKTSPFSTFTHIALGKVESLDSNIHISKTSDPIKFHIKYNNVILKYIVSLITKNYELRGNLSLHVNPTVGKKESLFTFFTNIENIEAIQYIQSTPIIEYIFSYVSQNDGITFAEMLAQLSIVSNANNDELNQFLYELTKTGFLELRTGISGLDQAWEVSLKNYFSKFTSNDIISHVTSILNTLIKLKVQYSTANSLNCKKIIVEMNDNINNLIALLHNDATVDRIEPQKIEPANDKKVGLTDIKEQRSKKNSFIEIKIFNESDRNALLLQNENSILTFPEKGMIYEDTKSDLFFTINKNALRDIVDKMKRLIETTSSYCSLDFEKTGILNFFKKNNIDDSLPLLAFYEKIYRQVHSMRVNQNKGERNLNEKSGSDEEIENERLAEFIMQLKGLFNPQDTMEEEFFLSQLQIEEFNNLRGTHNIENVPSKSTFCQFYESTNEDGNPTLYVVINSIMPGHGKLMSRFLYMFDQHLTENLVNWNISGMEENEMLVENSDASVFNANLHKGLAPFEISMPGGQNRLDKEYSVQISDILIGYDDVKKDVVLRHKNGKYINVLDLGFQGVHSRSKLFQLLSKFGPNSFYNVNALTKNINFVKQEKIYVDPSSDEFVTFLPRIIYEKNVILKRKKWIVPNTLFPKLDKKSEALNFAAVNIWRKKLRLPDEVFFTINKKTKTNSTSEYNKDDRKPQYLNFSSPIAIKVLEKNLRKASSIQIEEMLPNSSQLLKYDSKPIVSEFLLQWR